MRAVRLITAGAPLEDRDLPAVAPGPDEVLVSIGAAGICRSDLHYRSGFPAAGPLPLTLGHEIAGTITEVGESVVDRTPGQRVGLHYLVTCGTCRYCAAGVEQFCPEARMLGKDRDGGYAAAIAIPARNTHLVPDSVPIDHAAVMMCSTATSLHALRKARLVPGETVAVLGVGGLGMAAVQLAAVLGAARVIAVDIDAEKLATAARLGAVAVEGGTDLASRIRAAAGGPVAVTLDLVGSVPLLRAGLDAAAPMGRIVAVGLTAEDLPVAPYRDLIVGERTVVGSSDHLGTEIDELLAFAADGTLRFDDIVTNRIPLDAAAVNSVLDDLAVSRAPVRSVIVPEVRSG